MKPQELFATFYPRQCTLLQYLSAVKDRLHCPNDLKSYNDMLKQTIVCYHDDEVDLRSFTPSVREGFHMRDVQQRVIEMSCHSLIGSAGNIISVGYHLVRDRNNSTGCASSMATVVNKYPNSAVEFLSSKCWQALHKRIGDDLMIHLLKDVSLFVMVKNQCYMQVAGYPMYNLEPIRPDGKQENEGSSVMQELDDANMPKETAQNMMSQNPIIPLLPVTQDIPLQQDSQQNVLQHQVVHQNEPGEEESGLDNMDYETEISQQHLVEEHSFVQEDNRQGQVAQETSFSIQRTEETPLQVEFSIIAEEIPQNVVVPGTNSPAGHILLQQQQNVELDDQTKEPQKCKKKGKQMKRKKPSCFEGPSTKRARFSNPEKPQSSKLKDRSTKLGPSIFNLYFPQPTLMYSKNLRNRFPKCHILSSTPASKRGATKLIEDIFTDSEFVLDKKTKQTRVVAKKIGIRKEGEKKKRGQRLPRRFVGMKGLFERMLKRHKKCRFNALLKHHCKGMVDVSEEKEKQVEKSVKNQEKPVGNQEKPVENQEKSVGNQGKLVQVAEKQAGIQEKAMGILQSGRNQDEMKGKEKEGQKKDGNIQENRKKKSHTENRSDPGRKVLTSMQEKYDRAVQNFTQRFQVVRFVVAVCNRVIPKELWGSSQNKKAFYNNLKSLINLNKGEKYSLGQTVNGIKIRECKWLKCDGSRDKGIPLSESEKQRELLHKWIWWLIRRYIMVILKSFFYITENAGQTREIFFYRKPVWKIINDFGVAAMERDLLKSLSKEEANEILSSNSSLGYSYMRFLPKAQTVRPIINMKHQPRSNPEQKIQASINARLRNLFEIIKFEKSREPPFSDSTVLGNDGVYEALGAFYLKRKERQDERSLYMVHVDINKCFDSIPLDKLYGILEGVFQEEEYIVRRFVAIKSVNNMARKVFSRKVDVGEDCRSFKQFLEDMIQENNLNNVIFVDQVYYNCEDRENILALLKKHLFDNIVKIGSKFYKQIKGIAQGSILSTYLCNYFYSHMEKRHLQQVIQDESSLLMRWVDDFLFLTPNRALADTFLRIMHAGIPEYGCKITSRKTLVNYETTTRDGLPVRCIGRDEPFPWCGFLIHSKSLETKLDFSKYEDGHRNTVLRNLHSHPGRNLLEKLRYSLLNKSHPLLLDTQFNSRSTVLSNIYEAFCWSACKFYNYCRDFPKGRKIQENPSLCLRVILALPQFFSAQAELKFKKLARKAPKKPRRQHVFGISRNEVEWLCCQAYVKYLKKKPSFKFVVKALRKRIPKVQGKKSDMARNVFSCHLLMPKGHVSR